MERVIADKRYNESVAYIQKYIEDRGATDEQKEELADLYKRLTVDKEDPLIIYERVHNLTHGIWFKGYMEHERRYMWCTLI
jgi:hypothetical protein